MVGDETNNDTCKYTHGITLTNLTSFITTLQPFITQYDTQTNHILHVYLHPVSKAIISELIASNWKVDL